MTSRRASRTPRSLNFFELALLALLLEGFFIGHLLATEKSVESSLAQISKLTAHTPLQPEWSEILTTRNHYLGALEKILVLCDHQLTSSASANLLRKGLPPSDPPLNPWGSVDQETQFAPQIDFVHWHPEGHSKRPDDETLRSLIPHQFRLAEQMGLGRNALHLRPQFIDPRFHSRVPYGFSVKSRILHELFGTFTWQSTNQVETFRYQIESFSRHGSAIANFGSGVKPHHIGISQEEIKNAYAHNKMRAWELEKLQHRILNEGNPMGLSTQLQLKQAPLLKKLRLELRQAMDKWASDAEEMTLTTILDSQELAALMEASSSLHDWKKLNELNTVEQGAPIGMGTNVEAAQELVSALSRPDQSPETLLQTHKYFTAVGAIHKLGVGTNAHSNPSVSRACLGALSELALHFPKQ